MITDLRHLPKQTPWTGTVNLMLAASTAAGSAAHMCMTAVALHTVPQLAASMALTHHTPCCLCPACCSQPPAPSGRGCDQCCLMFQPKHSHANIKTTPTWQGQSPTPPPTPLAGAGRAAWGGGPGTLASTSPTGSRARAQTRLGVVKAPHCRLAHLQ